jgi:hypothetical protein
MKRLKEKLALANMVMSVGILLTIVPLVVGVMNIASTIGDESLAAKALLGWTYVFIIYGLLPVGLLFFAGGLTWMFVLRRKLKSAADEEDEEDEK